VTLFTNAQKDGAKESFQNAVGEVRKYIIASQGRAAVPMSLSILSICASPATIRSLLITQEPDISEAIAGRMKARQK
jgi:hypothetical protein